MAPVGNHRLQTARACRRLAIQYLLVQRNGAEKASINLHGEHVMAKARSGLDGRHRDKSGKIEKKHGNTRLAALRKEYGPGFAKGHRKDMMLKTLLKKTGSESLHDYLRHHHR